MPNPQTISSEYQAALRVGGFARRDDRALLSVSGADRAIWLNNLVTNVIKTLSPGDGNYAFATNVKGRVAFDMNMLALPDRIWLDIDGRQLQTAITHLNRYIITEEVQLADITSHFHRIAVMGPHTVDFVTRLGFGNLSPMSQLQHVAGAIGEHEARMMRNDYAGLTTAEFFGDEEVVQQVESAARAAGMVALESACMELLRIEAGIPRSVEDIDEEVVPPETGQIERGINYHKGCYLGQEVIERMRSHGSLARKLVGLRIDGDAIPPRGSAIQSTGQDVGRITSACWSEALSTVLALGYLKTTYMKKGAQFSVADRSAALVTFPVRQTN
jgi:folate-binding protein YgfZ